MVWSRSHSSDVCLRCGQSAVYVHTLPPLPPAVDVATTSGTSDSDYPTLATQVPALANLPYVGDFKHTPLPPELIEHFDRIQLRAAKMEAQGGSWDL